MAQTTQRINGQLVQTDDANTEELARLQGQTVQPVSPGGAASIGANPDQAKMVGSSAQKDAAAVQQVQPKTADTLQTAQRTQGPRQQASTTEDQAATKAAQLQNLGSLHSRVEALINEQLKLQSPAQGQVSQTQIGAIAEDKRAGAQALLDKIIANPNDAQAVADATNFWVENGLGTIQDFTPQKFIATAQESLGGQAAKQVADVATLGQMTLEPGEQAALDEALGKGTWKDLSVPQLQQKIEELRQAEFNRVQAIRAQLPTATGAQREMLLRDLGDTSQVGVTGTEASVRDLKAQIDQADTVTVGGEEYKVGDLLKDEQISDLVKRMLDDPELAKKVAASNPEFAKWVSDNAQALKDLATTVTGTKKKIDDVWTAKRALANIGPMTLSNDLMRKLIPDWDKATVAGPDLANNGILNALRDPSVNDTRKKSLASALESVAVADPDQLKLLQAMTPEQFNAAYDLAQSIDSDTTGLLEKLTGVGRGESFVTDPKVQQQISTYKQVTDALAGANIRGDVLQDPALAELIKSGQFQAKHAPILAQHPDRLKQYTDANKTASVIRSAKNIDEALDAVFGRNVDINELNRDYQQMQELYRLDPTDAGVKKKLDLYRALDKDGNGLGDSDLASIIESAAADVLPGAGDFESVLNASDSDLAFNMRDKYNSPDFLAALRPSNFAQGIAGYMKDGKITAAELADMPGDLARMVSQMPADWLKANNVASQQDVDNERSSRENAKLVAAANDNVKRMLKGYNMDTVDRPEFANGMPDEWVYKIRDTLKAIEGEAGYEEWEARLHKILNDDTQKRLDYAARLEAQKAATKEAAHEKAWSTKKI